MCSTRLLVTWGSDSDGQLGLREASADGGEGSKPGASLAAPLNNDIFHAEPQVCPALRHLQVSSVSCGSRHSLCVTSDGMVFSWGWGKVGQLGHGACFDLSAPQPIKALSEAGVQAVEVSAGGIHSAVLASGGNLYTFGSSGYGQLGLGPSVMGTEAHSTPSIVRRNPRKEGRSTASALASRGRGGEGDGGERGMGGRRASLTAVPSSTALEDLDGRTAGEGQQSSMEASVGPPSEESTDPDAELVALRVQQVSCGGMHTAAVTDEGKLFTWGRADSGQLGIGYGWVHQQSPHGMGMEWPSPVTLRDADETVETVSCGAFHTAITTNRAEVYTWGKEDYGMLGCSDEGLLKGGLNDPHKLPLEGVTATDVQCGAWHTVISDRPRGQLWVCGRGEYGRLGIADENCRRAPVLLDLPTAPGEAVKQVAAGATHTLLLTTQGRVFVTGRADDGRLGPKLGPKLGPGPAEAGTGAAEQGGGQGRGWGQEQGERDRELCFRECRAERLRSGSFPGGAAPEGWKVDLVSAGGKHSAAILVPVPVPVPVPA